MAIARRDEILEKALLTDESVVPRYNIRTPDGTAIAENVALELTNSINQQGTPVNAMALNEMLAASGITSGTETAYTLEQENYHLFDGAPIRVKFHVTPKDGATLNINGTGNKLILNSREKSVLNGIKTNTWLSLTYSEANDAYVLIGSDGLLPQILVAAPSGAEVVCTNGEIEMRVISNGSVVFDVPEYGTWVITSTQNGTVMSDSIVVDTVKQYFAWRAFISTTLNNNTWEQISMVSQSGMASSIWSVGDRKADVVNGTMGGLTISNRTRYMYILGFDHNSEIEGANRIHFQLGYTQLSGGTNIAFVDSQYGKSNYSGSWFNMRNENYNTFGWKDARMRNYILPEFKNCLSVSLQSVIKTIVKYTFNATGGTDSPSKVTATTEEVFLLAEFEVEGKQKYASATEQTYQKQYEYYKNGNSKIKYRSDSINEPATWWLRSPLVETGTHFCVITGSGESSGQAASYSWGLAPAFCV